MALLRKRKYRMGSLSYCQEMNYNGSAKYSGLLLRDRLTGAKNLFRKDLKGHFGCVNAIEFSHLGGQLIASGGDDRRVLVWNTEKCIENCCVPVPMNGQHHSNIFCLMFDSCNRKIFSGGNDEQVIVHDVETKQTVDVFLHEEAVYGLSVDPINDNVFVSACDDGKVLLYDIRASPAEAEPFCIADCRSPMHSVSYNPVEPRLLATANAKEGLALWDVRYPKRSLLQYGGKNPTQSCMSVRFNRNGNLLIGLRRRLPPVMFKLHETNAVCKFDHNGYYNSCTMKSCCFAGDNDQYLVSGSDDFNLYMWRIPDPDQNVKWVPNAHMVLRGHRSIANQVRFNPGNHLLISSGVEKVIKMWSPFPIPYCQGDLGDGEFDYSERPVYTHEEYINLVLRSGQVMSHDYSNKSTEEDPRMMAFFDSLVQRELEGFSSDDSANESDNGSNYQPFVVQANTSSDTGSNQSSQSGDEEGGLSPFTMAFAVAMARRARQPEDEGGGEGDADRPEDILDVHSSFMERLDELNNEGNGEGEGSSSSLPGQRPNSARRSIAELIDQKRKEFIEKAKTDKKAKKASAKESTTSTSESSLSSSDSDGESGQSSEKGKKNKTSNRKQVLPTGKTSHNGNLNECENSASSHDSADVMKELAAERQKFKSRMKSVKVMRNIALHDHPDTSNSDKGESSGANVETNGHMQNAELQDRTNIGQHCAEFNGTCFSSFSVSDPSEVADSELLKKVKKDQKNSTCDTKVTLETHKSCPNKQTFCDREHPSSEADTVNGHTSSNTLTEDSSAGSGNLNTLENDLGASDAESTAAEPMWSHFKKFRNRVQKAHRQYRKSSTQRENSECSSGEEI